MKKRWTVLIISVILLAIAIYTTITNPGSVDLENYQPKVYSTFAALLPPVLAIVLALITKEVYSSLFAGIVLGAL